MIGRSLNQYQITARIGAGGMGEVFRARDTRLNREVALKMLPTEFVGDSTRLRRFEQETNALAALNHPNVLTIHDAGVHEGAPYLVSELLEGHTLRDELQGGPLPPRKAAEYALQIAQALAAAHASGVIHRDLKPENIFVTRDGRIKVLDFGLAKLKSNVASTPQPGFRREDSPTLPESTVPGLVLGTPAYMSPEQARGDPLDARTDIFSFGSVLWELLAGVPAFRRKTAVESMNAVLNDPAPDLDAKIPAELRRIVERCLQKTPDDRFQSSKDLAFTLAEMPAVRAVPLRSRKNSIQWIVALLAGLGLALLAWRLTRFRDLSNSRSKSGPADQSIAVLPFLNKSSEKENEYLSDGIADQIRLALAKVAGLRVAATTSSSVFKGRTGENILRRIGDQLKVTSILEGSVQKSGTRLLITAELINVHDGFLIWSQTYDQDNQDLITIQLAVARRVVEELKVKLQPAEKQRLSQKPTADPEAMELYWKGNFQFLQTTEAGFHQAITLFDQAINKDPSFALAYAGKAIAYAVLGNSWFIPPREAIDAARKAAERAVQLDDTLAEARLALALAKTIDCDWVGGEREFQRAIELNPRFASAHQWYGVSLCFRGKTEEAIKETRTAQNLDPLSAFAAFCAGWPLLLAKDHPAALSQLQHAIDLDPNLFLAHEWIAWVHIGQGHYPEAIERLEKALAVSNRHQEPIGMMGYALGMIDDKEGAIKLLRELEARAATTRYACPVYPAMIQAVLNQTDQAFALLDRATKDRDLNLLSFIKSHPYFERLRSEPRFEQLLNEVRLTK